MADPISVIGLVSGIITFIDFGYKVISGARNVRSASHGFTADVHELNMIVEDVQKFNKIVKEQGKSGQQLSKDERSMLEMVTECDNLVFKIRDIVKTLRKREEARSKTLESARVFTRSFFKQGELQALQTRLEKLDSRIRINTANALQKEHNSSITKKLGDIEESQRSIGVREESRLDAIRDDIQRLAKQNQEIGEAWTEKRMAGLQSLLTKLRSLQKEHDICSQQIKVLESLYFTELRRRWYLIPYADQRTNDWVFNPEQTYFKSWLETKDEGIFYITGKAGSGKSTLMKYISEQDHTEDSLRKWAGSKKLYTASFYFWNQGTDLQKSSIGLLRSLLYQILRSVPDLIRSVCEDRLHHEEWELGQLKKVFHKLTQHTELDTNFCFFIDGLDEYEGEENDVTHLLETLSISSQIKICVSSRPGRQYEDILPKPHQKSTIDIARFTKQDMENYINTHLKGCSNWLKLRQRHAAQCQEIIQEISARASGVWLWVSLVTTDIVKEAEKNEGIETLTRVVDNFPDDLHKYFEKIIQKIPKIHREEMAQIFLIVAEELQPLPLYGFALLAQESSNSDYAIALKIQPLEDRDVRAQYNDLQDRIRNRCSDLLIVDDGFHPLCLTHTVDFLHRTVRDFLRDYHSQLQVNLVRNFNPLISLSRIWLALLKHLPITSFQDRRTANKIIGITDEILYYARELEKRGTDDDQISMIRLLDELNDTNRQHASCSSFSNHWTNARDSPTQRGLDEYNEGGQCNWIALTVQARLVKYVRAKLNSDPRILHKRGRPLLDYALRPRRTTPISMPYHSVRDDPSVDTDMISMLLENGADANQPVHINGGKSVWALFLHSIYSDHMRLGGVTSILSDSLNKAWYQACRSMIQAGARQDCLPAGDVEEVFLRVFGEDRAAVLTQELAEREMEQSHGSCTMM
ncbi:unnamed protein product [Periconia digitata]|uniref:NACHT domain-containing protein n=1 Tax=Periconia digitata TaxID=1303443 RepID=A0A9W4XXN6_9PLEO|nr:unnamed protein product [Periconia digitata]